MKPDAAWSAALGPRAQLDDRTWRVADPEAARRAVELALEAGTPLSPGASRDGCTTLCPPAGICTLWSDELVGRIFAGTTFAQAESDLGRHGLSLGVEVAWPGQTTLGAAFAAGNSGLAGPRGYRLRDRCVGLSFVDGQARLLAAGARVVKNVAGYDFGRLHHGAKGSLGLLLDLTLRLVRAPRRRTTVWWACERPDLPRLLPELRQRWGHDAVAELLVDAAAAAATGLPGPGIVFRQFGDPDLIDARIGRSGGLAVDAQWIGLLQHACARAPADLSASGIAQGNPGHDWVFDAASGVLFGGGAASQPYAQPAAAVAVKRVLDPHGIWPALPAAGVRS